jgi:hypothetical protein
MKKSESPVGKHVKIEYHDQNDNFAFILPRYGVITRKISAEHNIHDWFVVKLEKPFDYRIRTTDAIYFDLLHCEKILIRSRWKKHQIGDQNPTSVFILLIRDENLLNSEPIKVEMFCHVAWGMCHTILV